MSKLPRQAKVRRPRHNTRETAATCVDYSTLTPESSSLTSRWDVGSTVVSVGLHRVSLNASFDFRACLNPPSPETSAGPYRGENIVVICLICSDPLVEECNTNGFAGCLILLVLGLPPRSRRIHRSFYNHVLISYMQPRQFDGYAYFHIHCREAVMLSQLLGKKLAMQCHALLLRGTWSRTEQSADLRELLSVSCGDSKGARCTDSANNPTQCTCNGMSQGL